MSFPYFSYPIHPPPIPSHQHGQQGDAYHQNAIPSFWRRWTNTYNNCKCIALGFNIVYMIHILSALHESTNVNYRKKHSVTLMTQLIFQLLFYSLMLFCLIVDIIIISTRKLSVATCLWRPGVFFFILTIGDQSIRLLNFIMKDQYYFDVCVKEADVYLPVPATVSLCDLQIQVKMIAGVLLLCRDAVIASAYVLAMQYYVNHLIRELKRKQEETLSLNTVISYRGSGINNHQPPSTDLPMTEPSVIARNPE